MMASGPSRPPSTATVPMVLTVAKRIAFSSSAEYDARHTLLRAPTMSLRATLRDHLLTIWAGEPWYGSPSKKILEDVTAAEASAHPLAGAQSIWEATLHMVAWTEEIGRASCRERV